MNDQLNSVLNRYEAFKKGDYSAAANPIPSELARFVFLILQDRFFSHGDLLVVHRGRKNLL